MNVWKNTIVALLMTAVMAVVLGLGYPLVVTAIAQALFSDKANGQLVYREGRIVGSRLIGQPFSSAGYFRSRPSAAGSAGYDPTASGGSNFGPTNRALVDRVAAGVAAARRKDQTKPVPIDLVTASGSGLDPHISPAAAEFQMARVARERGIPESVVRRVVAEHTEERDLGVLGEARVNVLLLNLALDARYPMRK
ncbi:MAG: potassium-transporting ATPase subunit KdpC [Acidobacteria bacterium]|nr:potassium-transporting ATPase subunit KdpC [Acidobacteriota bacterium]